MKITNIPILIKITLLLALLLILAIKATKETNNSITYIKKIGVKNIIEDIWLGTNK